MLWLMERIPSAFSDGKCGSVKAKDIEKQPVNNPLLALQGRVPGLSISSKRYARKWNCSSNSRTK